MVLLLTGYRAPLDRTTPSEREEVGRKGRNSTWVGTVVKSPRLKLDRTESGVDRLRPRGQLGYSSRSPFRPFTPLVEGKFLLPNKEKTLAQGKG